jgi:hypothetical protein
LGRHQVPQPPVQHFGVAGPTENLPEPFELLPYRVGPLPTPSWSSRALAICTVSSAGARAGR